MEGSELFFMEGFAIIGFVKAERKMRKMKFCGRTGKEIL